MNNLQKLLTIVLILLLSVIISAQTDSAAELIGKGKELSKKAYLQYNQDQFLEARSVFEKALNAEESNLLPLYYITLVDYKLLEMSLRNGGTELFDKYYDNSLKNAETLCTDKEFAADGRILSAAIYMMKIAKNPMSAVTLSPKIHSLLDEANSINPNKPYSYVIRGMMKYNTPAMFGGSYEDALKNFNYAVKLFEKEGNENSINPVWGYAETFVWIGRTQEKLNNNEAAKFTYKKALDIEPEYNWVKYVLLPELEGK